MKTSNTPQIKSISPGLSPRTEDKTTVKQTGTDKAPHLDREAGLKKLFNSRTEFAIGFKAFFKSIGSDKKMDTIKTEMKESMKAKFHDRMDRMEKAKASDPLVRSWAIPTFESLAKSTKIMPFEVSNNTFQKNTKLLLSVQIDGFMDEARNAGAKTDKEVRSYVSTRLDKMVGDRFSLMSALGFNRDTFLQAESGFRSEGRSLKADIVGDFISSVDDLLSKAGSLEKYQAKSDKAINEEIKGVIKSPNLANEFLRGKEYDPSGLILHAHGMNKLAKDMESGIRGIVSVEGFADIPGDVQLKNKGFDAKNVETLKQAALKVIEKLRNFEVPPELRQQLSQQMGLISGKMQTGELDAELGKTLLHKAFNNAVILRVVNPSLNSSEGAFASSQRQLNLLTQLIQAVLNGNEGSKVFGNKESGEAFDKISGGLSNKFNQILVDKFGMPNDVYQVKPEPDAVQNQPEPPSFQDFLAAQRQPVDGGQVNPPENN